MPDFIIKSPDYSFVEFDKVVIEDNCCDGDAEFCIPVVEESDNAFQFNIVGTDALKIDSLFAADLSTLQLVLLRGSGNSATTIAANFVKNFTLDDGLQFERYRIGLLEITFYWNKILKDIKTLIECDECFQLAFIKDLTITELEGSFSDDFNDDFDNGGTQVLFDFAFFSNCFKRKCDDCYTALLEYYSEEDYAGFNYCNVGIAANRVRLPLHLTAPKTIEDKTVYRKSQGKIKKLRSIITKEYVIQTDHFPEHIHDKMAVALAHDEVNVYSTKYNGGIDKNGEYAIEWVDNLCKAPAQFKALATPFVIRNSNCGQCTEVDLLITCANLSSLNYTTQRTGATWQVDITGCNYTINPLSGYDQTVQIYYRQKFSTGAYTLAGTAVFNSLGTLISTSNPLSIAAINDNWDAIEIKAVNLCGSPDLIFNIDNPCAKLAGFIATTEDATVYDGVGWSILINDVIYSLWPAFGVHKTLTVSYREYGTADPFTVAGTIDLVVNTGYVVVLTPDPFVISSLDALWERAEVKIEYGAETGCGREVIQIFTNPMSGCAAVASVNIDDLQTDNASISWPRVLPTPSGMYDWELLAADNTTVLQSGNAWNPGGTIFLFLSGLTADTTYNFRVRGVCSPGEFSSWATTVFSTLP